jgi:K+-transporting ATPase KdpF subunit
MMRAWRLLQVLGLEDIKQLVVLGRSHYRLHPLPLPLFLLMMVNLAIAPAVMAATGPDLTRKAAYALVALGLVVLGLTVYLFVVIFQPERF